MMKDKNEEQWRKATKGLRVQFSTIREEDNVSVSRSLVAFCSLVLQLKEPKSIDAATCPRGGVEHGEANVEPRYNTNNKRTTEQAACESTASQTALLMSYSKNKG